MSVGLKEIHGDQLRCNKINTNTELLTQSVSYVKE